MSGVSFMNWFTLTPCSSSISKRVTVGPFMMPTTCAPTLNSSHVSLMMRARSASAASSTLRSVERRNRPRLGSSYSSASGGLGSASASCSGFWRRRRGDFAGAPSAAVPASVPPSGPSPESAPASASWSYGASTTVATSACTGPGSTTVNTAAASATDESGAPAPVGAPPPSWPAASPTTSSVTATVVASGALRRRRFGERSGMSTRPVDDVTGPCADASAPDAASAASADAVSGSASTGGANAERTRRPVASPTLRNDVPVPSSSPITATAATTTAAPAVPSASDNGTASRPPT